MILDHSNSLSNCGDRRGMAFQLFMYPYALNNKQTQERNCLCWLCLSYLHVHFVANGKFYCLWLSMTDIGDSVNMSLARYMHAYVNTLVIYCNLLKEVLIVTVTMRMIVCVSTTVMLSVHYFMLHYHFQWSYCSVYMLHTGSPLPDLLLAGPRHQGRELCLQHTAC